MRKLALLLPLLLAGACSNQEPGVGGDDGWPPKRFRDDTTVMVRFVSNVEAECYKAGLKKQEGTVVQGCNRLGPGVREIIVSNPCLGRNVQPGPRKTLCHEIGHINGWSGKHEQ